MPNFQALKEFPELAPCELSFVVRDYLSRDSETTYDRFKVKASTLAEVMVARGLASTHLVK
jgi:hypothetical protein